MAEGALVPTEDVIACVTGIIGWRPDAWLPVRGGYTPAARYVIVSGQRRAFVKIATNDVTARALRAEAGAYMAVAARFRPAFYGWADHGARPVLVIEALQDARWPPPWRDGDVEQVREMLGALHRSEAALPAHAQVHGGQHAGWNSVAHDPSAFLSLGLADQAWLDRALPLLVAAEAQCSTVGNAVTHWDVRSDNIALLNDGPRLVDWSEACLSNPRLDLGFWLPSLHFEGGPPPEHILPDAPDVAAWVSGYFAARAGLPIIPHAPFVRRIQRQQLATALSWAQRALGLPPLRD
ncbi:hypothetical protein AAC691_13620 [Nguyenibacter vanlangensis]|uniref:Aminoglycoside phosphotransferase domain-containing protein n=1 Tax=Nguyenibacter vanlangensis TaxID=1216886 RepID=A0ABZ3D0Q8_9PROT